MSSTFFAQKRDSMSAELTQGSLNQSTLRNLGDRIYEKRKNAALQVEAKIAELLGDGKHAEIEEIIAREEHRPCPDTMRLAELKKQKLRLKEEMSRFIRH